MARSLNAMITPINRSVYHNPVLPADWSDPDVIRVETDYYLVASSFNRVPGLPILHSRDLVRWSIIGHALDRLDPPEVFATPQRGCGVWAPTIRHHAGLFWIFYPDPDRGIFVVTAHDPAGPWSAPRCIKAGRGIIDPTPLWDTDGRAYLIHAWAKSRAGFNNRLTCQEMNPDATALRGPDTTIIDGDTLPGYRTLEGPKAYQRDGWYWIFAPAGGVADGWQAAFRSRSVFGPYEERVILAQGDTPINGPHQGAWVDTPGGEHWFLHFQDRGAYGRVVHLQPLRWEVDGWPVVGDEGKPVLSHVRPALPESGDRGVPVTGDEVVSDSSGPQWFWQANPQPGWSTPLQPPGLRLECVPSDHCDDLRLLPNVFGQRLPQEAFTATATLALESSQVGARAGLVILGHSYAWIGLEQREDGPYLVCRTADPDGPERDLATPCRVQQAVALRVNVRSGGICHFTAESPNGDRAFMVVDEPFTATAGQWVGATLGFFATVPSRSPSPSESPSVSPSVSSPLPAGHAQVSIIKIGTLVHQSTKATRSVVRLQHGDQVVAEYVYQPDLPTMAAPRPYLHPVTTLAGTVVTAFAPGDHGHHLGASIAVPDLSGFNFWGGRTFVRDKGSTLLDNHGTQRHEEWTDSSPSTVTQALTWLDPDGSALLRERRRLEVIPLNDRAWALDWDFSLANATTAPVVFASPATNGRAGAGYGGFFWRAPQVAGSATVLGSDGRSGARDLHGQRASWLAVSGRGSDAAAWTLAFVAADERTAKDPWFVRASDYIGVCSSLAWNHPLLLAEGETLRRRVVTIVADGLLSSAGIAALADRWL